MDVYALVNEKIIKLLEAGVVPWRKPWTTTGLPCNLVSKKPYRGVNVFLLSASKYVSPFWLTLRQVNELGEHIRKGEETRISDLVNGKASLSPEMALHYRKGFRRGYGHAVADAGMA